MPATGKNCRGECKRFSIPNGSVELRTIVGRPRREGIDISDRLVRGDHTRIQPGDSPVPGLSGEQQCAITVLVSVSQIVCGSASTQKTISSAAIWEETLLILKVGGSWMHVATVIDLTTRKVVGYAVDKHMRADLALQVLVNAPGNGMRQGAVFHSDRGSRYTSRLFGVACRDLGVTQSMGRVATCYDNAVAESFFLN
ncbi:transposase [Corynebacterium choanae]|uniref:Integrase core domain protein n=1 Tax=Corynebacterium choanae TaxID=1862358 RepID=A0A3G6J8B6_9CORY|nr:DDE-type integrase/transposase/recombinase [Corynebacterium choanae]AZA14351.1 Integrase core domain protein [Corynebacterium choanae]